MKLKTFGIIAAIVAFVFGIGFLVIPDTVMGFYGIQLNESQRFVCRYLGSALFGTSVTWWTALKAKDLTQALMGVILGAATLSLTGLLVGLWDAIAGPANNFTWINPILYGALALCFIYFGFKKTK